MTNQIFSAIKVTTLALILSFGISSVYAWIAPTATPPSGNVSAPINTSATAQTKTGGLTVGSITAPSHCIGASCLTAWPTGGVTPPVGSSFIDTSATAQTKTGGLTVGGLTLPAGSTVNGGGAVSTYGATTVQGAKTGWSGINFRNAAGTTNYGTLMMHPSYSGFFNAADNNWRWYVTDGGNSYSFGDVCGIVSGVWKCLSAAGGGTPSVGVYMCPSGKTPGANPTGGWWGSYGCQGQISSASTCSNIEYPWSENRACTYLGTLRIN